MTMLTANEREYIGRVRIDVLTNAFKMVGGDGLEPPTLWV
jgi:hypothetical protein